jgi:hypothetical protein
MSTYTVKHGDTLKKIATEILGDEDLVQYLASINNIQGHPGIAGDWFYSVYPGQVLETGVAEVTAKKWPAALIVSGVAAAIAGIYYRKEIFSFFKTLV